MRLKNSRSIDDFFSFHTHSRSLTFFLLERACKDAGHRRAPFLRYSLFLRAKGEQKLHDLKNAPKSVA